MKQVIDLRPVYHRREDRIRARVILCWLALLLIRVTENTSRQALEQDPRRAAAPARRPPGPATPRPSARPPT